jgi:aminopeptidase
VLKNILILVSRNLFTNGFSIINSGEVIMIDLTKEEKRKIAESMVKTSMGIGKKTSGEYESVYIRYNPTDSSCKEFAECVEDECWKVGAYTLMREYSSARSKVKYELSSVESIKQMDPLTKAIAETADIRMFIGEEDDPLWSESVANKVKLNAPNQQKLWEIMDNRCMRWIYFGWPIPGAAKGYGCPVPKFRKIFFNSIKMSFSQEMLELCKYYHSKLLCADNVRIISDDTDLSFRVKGRPPIVDDGIISENDKKNGDIGLNIPSGEVFIAPLETTAEGNVRFPVVVIPGFGRIDGLTLTFKAGKVVSFEADEGKMRFEKFLASNTGDKDRIAELGIGCNPGAEFTGGSIIIDEKVYRTIHIAIGNNTGSFHGVNKASSHLDMIKYMEKGKLVFDGNVVMEGGLPVK